MKTFEEWFLVKEGCTLDEWFSRQHTRLFTDVTGDFLRKLGEYVSYTLVEALGRLYK